METEAKALIHEENQKRELAQNEQRGELLEKPASAEWTIDHGTHQTILRQVTPPPAAPAPVTRESAAPQWTEEQLATFLAEPYKPHETIALTVLVFDGAVSEILWREEDHQIHIITNFDGNYLRGIGSIETSTRTLDLFPFLENITSTDEAAIAAHADELGFDYTPRAVPANAKALPKGAVAYEILTDGPIPASTLESIQATFQHFTANEAAIRSAMDRETALNAARQAYREANPPQPRDTIINFWPGEGSIHRATPTPE